MVEQHALNSLFILHLVFLLCLHSTITRLMSSMTDPETTDEAIITTFLPFCGEVSVKAHHNEELPK